MVCGNFVPQHFNYKPMYCMFHRPNVPPNINKCIACNMIILGPLQIQSASAVLCSLCGGGIYGIKCCKILVDWQAILVIGLWA